MRHVTIVEAEQITNLGVDEPKSLSGLLFGETLHCEELHHLLGDAKRPYSNTVSFSFPPERKA